MIEFRSVTGTASDTDGTLTGMVTPFGVETTIGDLKHGGFREEVAPGTFTKTLQEHDVVLIHNHDTAMPMARTSVPEGQPGHLSLAQEADGFTATGVPVDTSYARDVMECARAGILGMSFGFEVTKDDWFDDQGRASNPQAGTKRVIREVKLHEVSTTAFPAYTATMGTVSARDAVNAARGGEERKTAPKPYGDVEYADPKNGKYPVDTVEHAKAAWAYISQAKNAAEYPMNGVSLSSVKTAIIEALKKFGVKVTEENAAVLAAEFRDFLNPHGSDMAADGHGCSCLAAVDASLDSAVKLLSGIDRNTLPPEVNQAIDLVTGAQHLIGEHNKNAGIPDPDKPNGNSYQSPTGDPEAGSATSDDEAERADMALLAEHIRVTRDI